MQTKQNMNLEELVSTLEIQNSQKADYILPAKDIRMMNDVSLFSQTTQAGLYVPTDVVHMQLQDKLSIPSAYYRRMQSNCPELLANNVNTWLDKYNETKGLMLRTFESNGGNTARGLLSSYYNVIDNFDILFAALEIIKNSGVKVQIKECNITDKRMYVNIAAPEIEVNAENALRNYLRYGDNASAGNGIIAGFTIVNSEVGCGSYEISPRATVLRCMNGLIVKEDSFRKIHLGAKLNDGKINWSETTKKKNMELIMAQTKDAVNTFLSEGYLSGIVQKIERASYEKLEKPFDAIQNVCRKVAEKLPLQEDRKKDILSYFMSSGDHAASGIFQALTHEAQTMDADNRYELESYAFELLPNLKTFDVPFVSKN